MARYVIPSGEAARNLRAGQGMLRAFGAQHDKFGDFGKALSHQLWEVACNRGLGLYWLLYGGVGCHECCYAAPRRVAELDRWATSNVTSTQPHI